ncbi:DNA cytosine methyltransferase [Antrihabitans cavernicola]|uniref:DNA cytosine methyltransferase n=1 Tax=Antrihabitans cavernicola TaxID=2495913 RepID=UPI001F2965E1|nr:DNA cytosine methyltransferase [Spelaeibacter cavernicola]
MRTISMVEKWEPARAVLAHRFDSSELLSDVSTVKSLPRVDVLTAGFPCTDLSQAGRTQGIHGSASGVVSHVFRLLPEARPTWLVLENVQNMLVLDGGSAMAFLVAELEARGYRWAYRVVDSRSTGVPHRRKRVILVASRTEDPRSVLFADNAMERETASISTAYGFYWTEGFTGLGWATDAVPTLKVGSTVGIPSPPAIWVRDAVRGRQIVTPTIEDAEALQGFRRGWTKAATTGLGREGSRWRLVGNAVTTGVSAWVGSRLVDPGTPDLSSQRLIDTGRWPHAAYGNKGQVWSVPTSGAWPLRRRYKHLVDVIDTSMAPSLSARATAGFVSRTERSTLRFDPDFLVAVKEHEHVMRSSQ